MKAKNVKGDGWEVPPLLDVAAPAPQSKSETSRTRPVRAAGYGACPSCHATKNTGFVRSGSHFVWRVHERVTLHKVRMTCPASGVALCELPPRNEDVACPHG